MSQDEPERARPDAKPEAGAEQGPSARAPGYLSGADAQLRHTLRTPLNHIIGYSELLLEEARERGLEEMVADLQNIQTAGKELLTLFNDLFNPVAVEPGTAETALETPAESSTKASDDDAPGTERASDAGIPDARLLVVDDNQHNRDIVCRLLKRERYEVSTAENGAQALEQIKTQPPDLVLLDVMMPVMDGIEACKRMKDDPDTRLIPVVIMTALGQVDDRVRAIQAGADDFLTKPVNRGELLARIQTSLRLKHTVDHKLDRLKGAQEYLARFVPQSVVRQLEENPDAPELEKTDQDMSALFVDVTGYTRLSENMRQTADFMVEKYFSRYLDSIHDNGGDVTETSGDGLMVVFPGTDPKEHAVKAVHAALEILQKTAELNEQLKGVFDPISVHIGINSGIALIGPTKYEGASGVRWTYTALGPAINLASRIAGVAEGGMICVGPETARRIEGAFATKEIGKRQLKNVKGEVMIHQVIEETSTSRHASRAV
jgi:CheY-like chemotaxis protein/class 3 adenylate cyclase